MLDITLLGCGGMLPLPERGLTALLARYNGRMLLIDCGEGTQVSLRALGQGFIGIDYLLFTHVHADHISGLPGLLLSLGNYGRTEPLTVIGPPGIERVVSALRVIAPALPFSLSFMELKLKRGETAGFTLGEFQIAALGLDHGMPCIGYRIDIPRAGRFDPERAQALELPVRFWSVLQRGEPVEHQGRFILPEQVMGPPRRGLRVGYITDTRPMIQQAAAFMRGADLLIAEGLYGDEAFRERAYGYYHMMFADAARIAAEAGVGQLWLTHFSQALTNPAADLPVATKIFANTVVGRDRMSVVLRFDEE
ncbi:MAG: ribonuclease Z [Oscillospiraceae bacterium]|nr:ribonuclease Z [Oscillospiraceae bacterium]